MKSFLKWGLIAFVGLVVLGALFGEDDKSARASKLTRKPAAAFDTRVDGPELITGQASGGIARELSHHGFTLVAKHESFLVDRHNELVAGEADRAIRWGASLIPRTNPTA